MQVEPDSTKTQKTCQQTMASTGLNLHIVTIGLKFH